MSNFPHPKSHLERVIFGVLQQKYFSGLLATNLVSTNAIYASGILYLIRNFGVFRLGILLEAWRFGSFSFAMLFA